MFTKVLLDASNFRKYKILLHSTRSSIRGFLFSNEVLYAFCDLKRNHMSRTVNLHTSKNKQNTQAILVEVLTYGLAL